MYLEHTYLARENNKTPRLALQCLDQQRLKFFQRANMRLRHGGESLVKKLRQALILGRAAAPREPEAIPSWWFSTRRDAESKRRELGNQEMNPVDDQ
jgi:hypothetical protein